MGTGLSRRFVTTRSGSTICVHEIGDGPLRLFVIGGISTRSLADSAMRVALETLAARGLRCIAIDIPGSGESTFVAPLTMDTLIADIEEIHASDAPTLCAGASVGAWVMLLVHRRHPTWFRSMCAVAPAIDWDQQYVGPALRDGELGLARDHVTNRDGTALAPRSLLVSMAPHHLLREPLRLSAPLHVIAGLRDEMAPANATRQLVEHAIGAPCTAEFIPEGDHAVAKLYPLAAAQCFVRWGSAQLQAPASHITGRS